VSTDAHLSEAVAELKKITQFMANTQPQGWGPPEFIALVAAIVASFALWVSWRIFSLQREVEKRRLVVQHHEWYWSDEIREMRQSLAQAQKNWKATQRSDYFIVSLLKDDSNGKQKVEWQHISRLLFFFASLERYLEQELLDEKLTLEFFGEAQFSWFKDFIAAISRVVEKRERDGDLLPSWIEPVKKFAARVEKNEQKRKCCIFDRS